MGETKRIFPNSGSEKFPELRLEANGTGSKSIDAELLIRRAFEQDDNLGISILFKYYYQSLCSHAVRFVSSKEIAEDIVSDLFFEFHSRQLYLNIAVSYRAFLFTAVRNRAFDYVKVEMGRSTSLDKAEWLPLRADQQPDTITQFEELYQYVESVINAMPTKRRRVYLMHRFEGKKYREIAEELNLSTRTVEAHLHTATQHLRDIVRHKWLILIICLVQGKQGIL